MNIQVAGQEFVLGVVILCLLQSRLHVDTFVRGIIQPQLFKMQYADFFDIKDNLHLLSRRWQKWDKAKAFHDSDQAEHWDQALLTLSLILAFGHILKAITEVSHSKFWLVILLHYEPLIQLPKSLPKHWTSNSRTEEQVSYKALFKHVYSANSTIRLHLKPRDTYKASGSEGVNDIQSACPSMTTSCGACGICNLDIREYRDNKGKFQVIIWTRLTSTK